MSFSVEHLTVLDSSHADRTRRVSGPVGRSACPCSGFTLVEGSWAVRGLAIHRSDVARDVYVREDAWETRADVVDAARRTMRWVYPVTAEVSAVLSGDPQGIYAVASLGALSRKLPELSVGGTIVVLAQGHDPDNVDTIIRTAGAFGVAGVVAVVGMVDAASPKVARPGTGSVFHVPACVVPSLADARALIHGRNATLLGTSGGAASISLSDLLVQGVLARSRLFQSHAWAFSNEARGLSGDEMRLCDGLVSIPMTGDAKLLNVANAAAICFFTSRTVWSVEN